MATIKEYNNSGRDRATEDRRRHRQLVEESIKRNIVDIIAEESIIGQSKDKKIKIPIKSIKEYSFIYGKNTNGVGSGDGSEKRGDIIGRENSGKNGNGEGMAGNEEGEDIYETEITIEELITYLFEDLNLPDIDKKKLSEVISKSTKMKGYQLKGIPPRLAKKRSVIEKIKRKQAFKRDNECINDDSLKYNNHSDSGLNKGYSSPNSNLNKSYSSPNSNLNESFSNPNSNSLKKRFPFMEEDLRYKRVKEAQKRDFNAAVICIMDVSGSMYQTKKYLARSFYFLLYQWIRTKYSNVEVVFISHTTTAKEVNENEFFHKGESGGTYISSGYQKALEIIEQRYNPSLWNIYAFHCSDGDNWSEDNKKAIEYGKKLCEVCNLFGYGEITIGQYVHNSTIKKEFMSQIRSNNFCVISIKNKDEIFPALKKLLEKEGEENINGV